MARVDEIRSQLLGYIFDILVKFLAVRQTTYIKFEKLPRMADFAECAEMISRCMGNPDNLFLDAYYENIQLQTEEILETSAVASALLKFMNDRKDWKGNATELLEELDQIVGEKASKNKYWPKTSSVLSRRINEVKTNLQEVGISIKDGPQDPVTRVKTIVITKPSDIEKMPFESFEPFDRRGEDQSSNDMNGMNGILHNSDGPTPQNITSNDVGSEIVNNNTTNPKLPPNVFRLGHSDKFACKLCNLRDDKWGMINHYHPEGEDKK